MSEYKTIRLNARCKPLCIEAPGCVVNIELWHDPEGRHVTRVDVYADGDRYAGEPQWWCTDAGRRLEPKGIGIRIVQGIPKPETQQKGGAA